MADAEKFLTIFAGTTIHVPSTKDLEEEERNVSIYESLSRSDSREQSRRLGVVICKHYKLTRRELRQIYKQTRRKFKEAKKFIESDQQVSKLSHKKRIRIRRKNKRRQ